MSIIRFHHRNKMQQQQQKTFAEDYQVNKSKILAKALQGLENLFHSMKSFLGSSHHGDLAVTWLKLESSDQLGDILAIIKDLSFYGVQQKSQQNSTIKVAGAAAVEFKLEPSNDHELLLSSSLEKVSRSEENEEDLDGINYGDTKNNKFTSKSKQPVNSDGASDGARFKKKSYYGKNSTNKQQSQQPQVAQAGLNLSDSCNSKLIAENSTNSLMCYKETQVPLILPPRSLGEYTNMYYFFLTINYKLAEI